MLSVNDIADRQARTLDDGEILQTGKFRLQWLDTPHLPHGWEAGLIMEHTTGTLLCSDLFADGGMAVRTILLFLKATFSGQAMPFVGSWGISTRTLSRPKSYWHGSPH
jgi:hypothetical protein